MPKRKIIAADRVPPLFGSGEPLCWCGALAVGLTSISGKPIHATLCRAHRLSEERLQADSVARADAVLALHFDKAGQRREEGSCE